MFGKGKEMNSDTEKQLNGFIVKQKALLALEHDDIKKHLLMGVWHGFITGLKLTNAITFRDYKKCYEEIENFIKELNKHEEIKKSYSNISITGYGYEPQGRCQAK